MSKEFKEFSFGTQVRKSPFSDAALRWGAKGFSVYNHMYIPRDFGDPVQNFWNLVNDPILLKLAEDHFWLSIADSDVLLWAKGVAVNAEMEVEICEPDVSPLQLQGPKSREILRKAFGDAPAELKYYRFMEYDWEGVSLVISRTGWSSELGYEIFLRDGEKGSLLW